MLIIMSCDMSTSEKIKQLNELLYLQHCVRRLLHVFGKKI